MVIIVISGDYYDPKELFRGRGKKAFFESAGACVAFARESIVISKRGKPMAMLVPPSREPAEDHLSKVKAGWTTAIPFSIA